MFGPHRRGDNVQRAGVSPYMLYTYFARMCSVSSASRASAFCGSRCDGGHGIASERVRQLCGASIRNWPQCMRVREQRDSRVRAVSAQRNRFIRWRHIYFGVTWVVVVVVVGVALRRRLTDDVRCARVFCGTRSRAQVRARSRVRDSIMGASNYSCATSFFTALQHSVSCATFCVRGVHVSRESVAN